MEENLKVDKDYMEAFNLGYELAKELNLKSPMFKEVNSKNERMNAIQSGMEQYNREITKHKNLTLDRSEIIPKKHKNEDNQKGNELSI
ncbi:hypothetical protein DHD32_16065 [Arenibacter sp. TNZ]|uniref:hypothetical protein n=1 Tax=Arenibacter TaxID=178469 RepID=UPI000CD3CA64|nr:MULTISPECIES: hypothetical protein [Arenibacter]MCM4173004.1 hypothetical protein [Arenibacter sp. TNZ]